ncbi:MAG: hypothetical protein V7K56_17340 [Nostoc sp.]
MGHRIEVAACLNVVMRTVPAGLSRSSLKAVSSALMSSKAGRSVLNSRSPASVVETFRVVRASSRIPRRSSSALMAWLKAEADMPSFTAARVKLISSATTTKAARSFSSSRFITAYFSLIYADYAI